MADSAPAASTVRSARARRRGARRPAPISAWGAGLDAKPLDAVREIADLLFQPFDRHRPRRGRGQKVADFFGLRADALERRGIDDALGDGVDFGVDRANLALEPLHGGLRIVRAQSVPDLRDQRLERRDERVARAAVAHRRDALAQIAHRAFERDDGVARRQIGEAARHRRELGAQSLHVDGRLRALFALFAAHLVEARLRASDLVAQRVDQRRPRAGAAAPLRRFRRCDGRRQGPRPKLVSALPALEVGRCARASSSLRRRAICETASCRSMRGRSGPRGASRRRSCDGLDAARERAHTRVEFAFGLVEARFQAAGRVGRTADCWRAVRWSIASSFSATAWSAARSSPRSAWLRSIQRATDSNARAARASVRSARLSSLAIAASSNSSARRASSRLGPGSSDLRRSSLARTRAQAFVRSVVAARKARNAFADRVEPVVAFEIGGFDALLGGFVGDDFVEPIAQAHAGAARGLFGERARLAPYASDVPSRRAVHGCQPSPTLCRSSRLRLITAPRADVSALVVNKPLRSPQNGSARAAAAENVRLYCGKTQLLVAFSDKCVIFARVRGGRGGGWSSQPKGADGKDWP